MKKNLIIIVDPQNDFITGSLKVPGAEEAMKKLSNVLKSLNTEENDILVTLDWHPYDHCSFTVWPRHCVKYSEGACIYKEIFDVLNEREFDFYSINKGERRDREEYSAFSNPETEKNILDYIQDTYSDIYICGLAGDFCILHTLRDLYTKLNGVCIHVMYDCVASTDGGKTLTEYCNKNNIEMV